MTFIPGFYADEGLWIEGLFSTLFFEIGGLDETLEDEFYLTIFEGVFAELPPGGFGAFDWREDLDDYEVNFFWGC